MRLETDRSKIKSVAALSIDKIGKIFADEFCQQSLDIVLDGSEKGALRQTKYGPLP